MNGVLIINKPEGPTSHHIVEKVRKILNLSKIGHTGTLDPMATGVLVLCLGHSTRLVRFLQKDFKEYYAEMALGTSTDTQDRTGEVIETKKIPPLSEKNIEETLNKFRGTIVQVPPIFSALKIKGKRLYQLAREGGRVTPSPRKTKVFNLSLEGLKGDRKEIICLKVRCSKGTYIRTLCSDIGTKLGCGSHLSKLVRLRCGDFTLDNALTLEKVKELKERKELSKALIPPEEALSQLPWVGVKAEAAQKICHGVVLRSTMIRKLSNPITKNDNIKIVQEKRGLLAIYKAIKSFSRKDEPGVLAQPECVLVQITK